MTGRVYALASGKGGVGKTTTTANLGVTLRAAGHSVALVDADLGMANLTTLLSVETDTTLHDVLAGEAAVEEALSEEASGFAVLPGTRSLDGFAAADPDRLEAAVETLAGSYDFVLVDTGAGLSYEDVLPLGLVDGVVLVTTPGDAAVGDTAKTRDLARRLGTPVVGVVVNRALETTDPEAVAAELGVSLLAAIPDDTLVTESTHAGQPIKAYAPESAAAEALETLAAALFERDERNLADADRSAEGAVGETGPGGGFAAGAGADESGGATADTAGDAGDPADGPGEGERSTATPSDGSGRTDSTASGTNAGGSGADGGGNDGEDGEDGEDEGSSGILGRFL